MSAGRSTAPRSVYEAASWKRAPPLSQAGRHRRAAAVGGQTVEPTVKPRSERVEVDEALVVDGRRQRQKSQKLREAEQTAVERAGQKAAGRGRGRGRGGRARGGKS